MSNKIVRVADGRMVEVDEVRYSQFERLRPMLAQIWAGDAELVGRDAQEALAFLISQLAYTESGVFERLYTPMQYEQFLPLSFEAGEWADTIRYEIYDYVGRGKRQSGRGRDINEVDVAYADKSFIVALGNIGYSFSQEELRRTAFLRRPISDRKLTAAIIGFRRHMNDVGLFGEAASNFTGLFNNALIPQGNAPVGLWAGGATTPDQILNDINTLIQNIWVNTAFNDFPTDIVMAPTAFSFISFKPRSTTSDTTILTYIKNNNIAKAQTGKDINFWPGYGLDTAGVGSTKRMIGYVKDQQRLVMHIPLPLRFLAPQLVGFQVQVPGEYKYSGVEVRYPKSAFYMDNL